MRFSLVVISVFVLASCELLNGFGSDECEEDSDCGGDDLCDGGQCVECENDNDCDEGETCEDGDCDVDGGGEGEGEGEGEACDVVEDCPNIVCECVVNPEDFPSPVNTRHCTNNFCETPEQACPSSCAAFDMTWTGNATVDGG